MEGGYKEPTDIDGKMQLFHSPDEESHHGARRVLLRQIVENLLTDCGKCLGEDTAFCFMVKSIAGNFRDIVENAPMDYLSEKLRAALKSEL